MSDVSAVPPKIQSFFDKGFLPGGGDLDVAKSFDSESRKEVSLNCISQVGGIAISLLHEAKGGLTVMIEESVGDEGILDTALARNSALIAKKIEGFPPALSSYATPTAREFALKQDQEFIKAIADKIHLTALFILDIEMNQYENESIDGCKEVGRPHILPDKINTVLISERIVDTGAHLKITVVSSKSMIINFCYKDEHKNPHIIRELGPIDVPDYQATLEKIAAGRASLYKKPIYTHMTRL